MIEPELLTTGTWLAGNLLALAGLGAAIFLAPWRSWLGDPERQWVWLGSAAVLVVVWSMKAGISAGLSVRFLMITAMTLMHGWQLAVIGAALVLVVLAATGQATWDGFGASLLCMAIVPALFSAWFHRFLHVRLPHNYFIYFFGTVFVGSALAFNLAGLARLAILAAGGALATGRVAGEYVAILPFMSFGEAVVNGTVMAMAVVYRPRWVMSFDDHLYLAGK